MIALLRGRLAGEVHARLADLSTRALRRRASDVTDVSLAGGLAGLTLAHASLAEAFPDAGHEDRAQQFLDRTLERIGREALDPGLYAGLAGVGWVLEHLAGGEGDDDDPCSLVDRALVRYLEGRPVDGPRGSECFDLVNGLVGIGVYALERLPRPAGKRLLRAVVGQLRALAVRCAPGVAWRMAPNAVFDLGVAHGTTGVIGLLGRILGADVGVRLESSARALLEDAVAWLLAQELPRGSGGCFAAAVATGLPRKPARLAWCYGDAGIAATLLVAARAAREPAWERAAVRVGLRAAARTEDSSGVRDAGLCHGAAGVAHIFHRLYRVTREKRFAEASRGWFARALALRASGPGFLMGSGGVALALLAATGDPEPAWNRLLLVP